MPRLTHEQFDEKVSGLAATYAALSELDFKPSGLTGGEVDDSVVYGGADFDPLGSEFARGVGAAFRRLRFDVGCWGRLTHDSSVILDEVGTDERLEMAGVLAMMTAPKDEEKFNEIALTIYELLDNVAQGNRVVVARPGEHRLKDGEWIDDVQECGPHDGKVQVIFENGHISSRFISIWSDRPEEIHAESQENPGHFPQVVFPLLIVDLENLAAGKLEITYPPEEAVA